MGESLLAKACFQLVKALHKSGPVLLGQEIAGIVEKHSVGAAIAAISSAWIPGAGASIATAACAGFVWTMYFRINDKLGIPLSQNIVKSVATAICTNLAASLVSILAATLLSFIPGIGTLVGDAVMTVVAFSLTWSSGLIYVKVLTRLAQTDPDWEEIDESTLQASAEEILDEEDVKAIMNEAKKQYKIAKDDGAIEEDGETVDVIEDADASMKKRKRKANTKKDSTSARMTRVKGQFSPSIIKELQAIECDRLFICPEIPADKLENAVAAMCVAEGEESIIALVDATFWGGSREGIVLTNERMYWKNIGEDPMYLDLQDAGMAQREDDNIRINEENCIQLLGWEETELDSFVGVLHKIANSFNRKKKTIAKGSRKIKSK